MLRLTRCVQRFNRGRRAQSREYSILKVIHGYPPAYNAGSEVYSQNLVKGLTENGHTVNVFTREEDPTRPAYSMRETTDPLNSNVKLHVINMPFFTDRYSHQEVDEQFHTLLKKVSPDIVHVGHLNHLSTSLVKKAAIEDIPVVHTIHDFWLLCPRGQFIQMFPETDSEPKVCDGQENQKCAEKCYSRSFSGLQQQRESETEYWSSWVGNRMGQTKQILEISDHFICPSRTVMKKFEGAGVPKQKLSLLPYGFDLGRLQGRNRERKPEDPFVFGYIGTHTWPKGIHLLIRAIKKVKGNTKLCIFGRPRPPMSNILQMIEQEQEGGNEFTIEWKPEYKNENIVTDVFNHVDCIVAPSIWLENSPLVIQEALQCKVPVITSKLGGMKELIRHEHNGLLFEPRDVTDLATKMQLLVDDPKMAESLAQQGFQGTQSGDIVDLTTHVNSIVGVYKSAISRREQSSVNKHRLSSPRRVTFDTNPDDCNLSCIMCEQHSEFSPYQIERKAKGERSRRMNPDIITRNVDRLATKGLKEVIPSTMGEPLMYKHFGRIIEACKKTGVKLNLTTNGTFLGKGVDRWANEIVPIASDVKISWNGATKETQEAIMKNTNWELVLGNVKRFIQIRDQHASTPNGNRCTVTFQLTFLETNLSELSDIVQLASDLGVDRVKGHHLWAHFTEIKEESMRRDKEAIQKWNVAAQAAIDTARKCAENGRPVKLENVYTLDPEKSHDNLLGSEGPGVCPFLGKEAWVNPLGRFDPCCAPDLERRALGEFGDLNEVSLEDVWNGEDYRLLRNTYMNRSLCINCNMRVKPERVSNTA